MKASKAAEVFQQAYRDWLRDTMDRRDFEDMVKDWFMNSWPRLERGPGWYKFSEWSEITAPRWFSAQPTDGGVENWTKMTIEVEPE